MHYYRVSFSSWIYRVLERELGYWQYNNTRLLTCPTDFLNVNSKSTVSHCCTSIKNCFSTTEIQLENENAFSNSCWSWRPICAVTSLTSPVDFVTSACSCLGRYLDILSISSAHQIFTTVQSIQNGKEAYSLSLAGKLETRHGLPCNSFIFKPLGGEWDGLSLVSKYQVNKQQTN